LVRSTEAAAGVITGENHNNSQLPTSKFQLSSIGFEFLALDRPLVVFHAPDLARVARINPAKIALLRSAATVVETPAELGAAADAAIARPSALSPERRRVAAAMFHRPGTATARALALACRLLDIPDPASVRADLGAAAHMTVS
jgi:hypothetical protein